MSLVMLFFSNVRILRNCTSTKKTIKEGVLSVCKYLLRRNNKDGGLSLSALSFSVSVKLVLVTFLSFSSLSIVLETKLCFVSLQVTLSVSGWNSSAYLFLNSWYK